jgi:hypothetical protein
MQAKSKNFGLYSAQIGHSLESETAEQKRLRINEFLLPEVANCSVFI